MALVDLALEAFGLISGSGDRPIRPRADGEVALPRLDPIGEDEGALAAAGDSHPEADSPARILLVYERRKKHMRHDVRVR